MGLFIYQVLQSDLVWTHKWPFQGWKRDLHLGNPKVTLKKLIYIYIVSHSCHTSKLLWQPFICLLSNSNLWTQDRQKEEGPPTSFQSLISSQCLTTVCTWYTPEDWHDNGKTTYLKMWLLWKMMIFPCHLNLLEGKSPWFLSLFQALSVFFEKSNPEQFT